MNTGCSDLEGRRRRTRRKPSAAARRVAWLTAGLTTLAVLLPLSIADPADAAFGGGVKAWGGNGLGQLGIEPERPSGVQFEGTNGPESCVRHPLGNEAHVACSRVPVSVPGLREATAVEAEEGFSVALLRNSTVVEWGGGAPGSAAPKSVSGLSGVTAVSRGNKRGVALLRGGTLMEWEPGVPPKPVNGVSQVASIAPHGARLAVLRNGTVIEWGGAEPVTVSGLSNVRAIARAGQCTLALLANGTLMASGINQNGCLGNPEFEATTTFVPVVGVAHAVAIAVGGTGPWTHSFAVLCNGTVMQWGGGGQSEVPQPEPGLHQVAAIAAAGRGALALALLRNGTVMAWGFASFDANEEGAFGDGTIEAQPQPVAVRGLTGATSIAAAGALADFGAEAVDTYGLAGSSRHRW